MCDILQNLWRLRLPVYVENVISLDIEPEKISAFSLLALLDLQCPCLENICHHSGSGRVVLMVPCVHRAVVGIPWMCRRPGLRIGRWLLDADNVYLLVECQLKGSDVVR